MKFTCQIGVMAYNEEANIGALLDALTAQRVTCCELQAIVIVASGCTDRTVEIARRHAARDRRVTVFVQERREGKAAAINLFLQHAKAADLVVLESADTLPADDETLERLLRPLCDEPQVGMTGAHPIPLNAATTFLGYVVHLQWRLHHRVALQSPKMGELVAFRHVFDAISADTAVDEAAIEALLVPRKYLLRYVPEALVYNKGPETVHDFLVQRRRITAGHLHLQRTQQYTVSTSHPLRIGWLLIGELQGQPKHLRWTIGAILLECWGRSLGMIDFYLRKKNPFTWDIATSTKILQK